MVQRKQLKSNFVLLRRFRHRVIERLRILQVVPQVLRASPDEVNVWRLLRLLVIQLLFEIAAQLFVLVFVASDAVVIHHIYSSYNLLKIK